MSNARIDFRKLRRIIDDTGMSVAEVANNTGVSQAFIYNLLSGDGVSMSVTQFLNLCYGLGIEPIDIIGRGRPKDIGEASDEARRQRIGEISALLYGEDLATLENVAEMALVHIRNGEHNQRTSEIRKKARREEGKKQ